MPHRGARIGVADGDLHVAQVYPGVGHGRDEGVAQHVRVRPGYRDCGGSGEAPRAAGGGVAVHPALRLLSRIGPLARVPMAWSMARPCFSPRSAMSAPAVSKIRKPSSPGMATSAKSYGFDESRAAVSSASNCR